MRPFFLLMAFLLLLPAASSFANDTHGNDMINSTFWKLNSIVFPKIEFHDTPLRDCVDYLNKAMLQYDPEPDPARRGISIILDPGAWENKKVTLSLTDASLVTILYKLEKATGTNILISKQGIRLGVHK